MNDVLQHARPEAIYEVVTNDIDRVSEINPHSLNFNFKDKEYIELKKSNYAEYIISKEVEKDPSKIIYKMYDYDISFVSYDWIIWLLNDITNPLKELVKGKIIKLYNKDVLERMIVKFKAGKNGR